MPNWCNNSITLKHKDPVMIERAFKSLCKGEFLSEFFPCPKDLLETVAGFPGEDKRAEHEAQQKRNIELYGHKDWYDWQVANWGTKWDVGGDDGLIQKLSENSLDASFDSAWAPPIRAYEQLCALGFIIKAYYDEPGMCFCGVFTGDEEDSFDDYHEYSSYNSKNVREAIGEELDDFWGISETMAQYEDEENLDIDLDGGLSAINEQEKE
jgi:hypothetical protein